MIHKTKLNENLNWKNKLASLEATLVRNYDSLTDSLAGVKCRATSVAKKITLYVKTKH